MRQTPSRVLTALIFITLSVTGVAACSEDPPEGGTLPTTSENPSPKQSPTPTTSPTPAPPTITPTSGESETRTLVRQYIALQNYAFATGDVEPMLALSSPQCQSCKGTADLVREVYGAGGAFTGDFNERIIDMQGNNDTILVISKDGNWSKTPSPGASPEVFKSATFSADYQLRREGNRWVVGEIQTLD